VRRMYCLSWVAFYYGLAWRSVLGFSMMSIYDLSLRKALGLVLQHFSVPFVVESNSFLRHGGRLLLMYLIELVAVRILI